MGAPIKTRRVLRVFSYPAQNGLGRKNIFSNTFLTKKFFRHKKSIKKVSQTASFAKPAHGKNGKFGKKSPDESDIFIFSAESFDSEKCGKNGKIALAPDKTKGATVSDCALGMTLNGSVQSVFQHFAGFELRLF